MSECKGSCKDLKFQAEEAEKHTRMALNALHSGYFLMHRVYMHTDKNVGAHKDMHRACEFMWKAIGELQEIVDEIYGERI